MRKITLQELKSLETILDWIRPVVSLDYAYCEEPNVVLLGDNYIINVFSIHREGVETTKFALIYGENHPGDDLWNLARWTEEDIATSTSFESLLPVFVANLFQRLAEEKVYSNTKLGLRQVY